MFLQLEHGESIAEKDIIGVFDLDAAGASPLTKPLFIRKEEQKGVVNLASDLPVSFVLAQGEYDDTVYISGLSTESIVKRAATVQKRRDFTATSAG